MRESWRRAHFDALRLFGVLLPSEGSVGVASLAALVASAPSASFLPLFPVSLRIVYTVEQSHDLPFGGSLWSKTFLDIL